MLNSVKPFCTQIQMTPPPAHFLMETVHDDLSSAVLEVE